MRLRIILCLLTMHLGASQCFAQLELLSAQSGWAADARSIYVFHSEISHDPAFGVLSGPILDRSQGLPPHPNIQGTSHELFAESTALDGPGFRVALLNQNSAGWFCGAVYESIFIDGYAQAGARTDSYINGDTDSIHANLVNFAEIPYSSITYVLGADKAADNDDGRRIADPADFLKKLQTIPGGEINIKQDNVGGSLTDVIKSAGGIGKSLNLVLSGIDASRERFAQTAVIIDQ